MKNNRASEFTYPIPIKKVTILRNLHLTSHNVIHRMSGEPIRKVPYVFWWNDNKYTVDPELFSKLSQKFAKEIQIPGNENQMVLIKVMEESTFKAFLAACQFEHYDINKSNAYDLLDLAIDWKVPSLETYVTEYINRYHLERTPIDYLGILLDHVSKDCDTHEDRTAVAYDINAQLEDPRFAELPPEVIYQILSIADRKYINQDNLINFVLNLLEKNPKNAVPLILRLDFTQMTQEQINKIYENPAVHQLNINYFIASSISAITNKTRIHLANDEIRHEIDLDVIRVKNQIRKQEIIKECNEKYDKQIDEIMATARDQQDQIAKLRENVEIHQRRMDTTEKKIMSSRTPCDRTVLSQLQSTIREQISKLNEESDVLIRKHAKDMEKFAKESHDNTDEYFKVKTLEGDNEHFRAFVTLAELSETNKRVTAAVNEMKDTMIDVKSTLMAKVVQDKMRFDEFIRLHRSRRYKIFDTDEKIWDLNSTLVSEASQKLQRMEMELDKLCPLRSADKSPKK